MGKNLRLTADELGESIFGDQTGQDYVHDVMDGEDEQEPGAERIFILQPLIH